jgi:outer membrane protein assembly factor BamB
MKHRITKRLTPIFCGLLLACSLNLANATEAPFDLTKAKGLWKTPLPECGPTPVLVGDLVLTTTAPDRVQAFRVADGGKAWEFLLGLPGAPEGKEEELRAALWHCHYPMGRIAPHPDKEAMKPFHEGLRKLSGAFTPVSDGTLIWVVSPGAVAACLDQKGQVRWHTKDEKQRPGRGQACGDPALIDGLLVYPGEDVLVARDAQSGAVRWQARYPKAAAPAPGVTRSRAWAHMARTTVWEHAGVKYLVTINGAVFSLDGVCLTEDCLPDMTPITPALVAGDRMILNFGDDHDGNPQCYVAYDLKLQDKKVVRTLAWTYPADHNAADRALPKKPWSRGYTPTDLVLAGPHLIALQNRKEGIERFALATGAAAPLTVNLPVSFVGHWVSPSPVVVGDRLYLANQDGRITAFSMGEQWTQAGELLIAGPKEKFLLSAKPLFTNGRMIVQTRDALVCYGN